MHTTGNESVAFMHECYACTGALDTGVRQAVLHAKLLWLTVKVKVKVIRPEAWIKETLPVARWLGVGLPYDHIFLGDCRYQVVFTLMMTGKLP